MQTPKPQLSGTYTHSPTAIAFAHAFPRCRRHHRFLKIIQILFSNSISSLPTVRTECETERDEKETKVSMYLS
jgi:hypothetical protein